MLAGCVMFMVFMVSPFAMLNPSIIEREIDRDMLENAYPSPDAALFSDQNPDFAIQPYFIENQGQISNDEILYYFTSNILKVGFSTSGIRFDFLQCNDDGNSVWVPILFGLNNSNSLSPQGVQENGFQLSYHSATQNVTHIRTYSEILFPEVYSHIDLKYYFTENGLKYDFIVHPGGDPTEIEILVGPDVTIEVSPEKVIWIKQDLLTQYLLGDSDLFVYQPDTPSPIDAAFCTKSAGVSYGFEVSDYDPTRLLIIDPLVLDLSRLIGSSNQDGVYNLAVDSYGNIVIVGNAQGSNFPVFGSYDNTYNGGTYGDVFVTKLSANGTIL